MYHHRGLEMYIYVRTTTGDEEVEESVTIFGSFLSSSLACCAMACTVSNSSTLDSCMIWKERTFHVHLATRDKVMLTGEGTRYRQDINFWKLFNKITPIANGQK